jgi:hypothetical protein
MHSHACGGGALAGLNVVPRPGVRRPGRRHQTSAATPRRGALTPISIRAMLSERAYYGRKAMALQRLSTSSSQSQPSAGPFLMPSPPPPARFAVLRAPAPILEFSRLPVLPYHARVPRLFTAAPHCPPGRCRSTPLPTLHGRPRPLLVPCSSPVPRARFCPAGPTVAPHSHRAANLVISGGTGDHLLLTCRADFSPPSSSIIKSLQHGDSRASGALSPHCVLHYDN